MIPSMKNAATVCSYLVQYAGPSLSDLTDEHLALTAGTGGKTAGWILGHLCVTGDFIRRKIGRPPLTPKEWGPKFTPGSKPPTANADYPRMAELRRVFDEVYRDLAAAAPSVSREVMDSANPFEFARGRFPTLGAFMCYIITGHLGYHLGQLSEWRSA